MEIEREASLAEIEQLTALVEEIEAGIAAKTETGRIRILSLAEAKRLGKQGKMLANYGGSALQYKLINHLPATYKNLKNGDLLYSKAVTANRQAISTGEFICSIFLLLV